MVFSSQAINSVCMHFPCERIMPYHFTHIVHVYQRVPTSTTPLILNNTINTGAYSIVYGIYDGINVVNIIPTTNLKRKKKYREKHSE